MRPTLAAALIGAVLATPAAAHPHVWIEAASVMVFGPGGGLVAIRHSWTFDKAFSAYATLNLDSHRDGRPDPDKLAELARRNVKALVPLGYYTHATADDERVRFGDATDAAMSFEGGRLTMTFSLPVSSPATPPRSVTQEVQDDSFFVAFIPAADPLRTEGAPAGCRVEVRRPTKVLEVGTQVVPDASATKPGGVTSALVEFGGAASVICP